MEDRVRCLRPLLQTSRAGNGPSASEHSTFTSDVTDTDGHRQALADSFVRHVDVSAPVHVGLRGSCICCHFSSQHGSGKMNDAKLILLVQNHQLLYNTNHKCYSDNAAKEEIWSAIGDELGQTGT